MIDLHDTYGDPVIVNPVLIASLSLIDVGRPDAGTRITTADGDVLHVREEIAVVSHRVETNPDVVRLRAQLDVARRALADISACLDEIDPPAGWDPVDDAQDICRAAIAALEES